MIVVVGLSVLMSFIILCLFMATMAYTLTFTGAPLYVLITVVLVVGFWHLEGMQTKLYMRGRFYQFIDSPDFF